MIADGGLDNNIRAVVEGKVAEGQEALREQEQKYDQGVCVCQY
jgi:hypothetical protein